MSPAARRRPGRRPRALEAGVGVLLALVLAGQVMAAAQSWSVSADKSTVPLGVSSTVTVTITNTSSDGGGGAGIGCVTIAIPATGLLNATYAVTGVTVSSVSNGLSWSASVSGSNPRGVKAMGDRLRGDPDDDVLVLKVHVTGKSLGVGNWTANEYYESDCTGNYNRPVTMLMSVLPLNLDTPTPKPTATPTAPPTPTATPTATATPTPRPTPSPGPTGSPGVTPTPLPTASAGPTSRPTASPSAVPTPGGTAAPTPSSTASPGGAAGGGTGSAGGGGSGSNGPGASEPPVTRPFELPGDPGRPPVTGFGLGTQVGIGVFEWAVPGVILTGPGLLLLLLIAAQATGALAWLPIVRRKIGAFGVRRPDPSH